MQETAPLRKNPTTSRIAVFGQIIDSNVKFAQRNPLPRENRATLIFRRHSVDHLDPDRWSGREIFKAHARVENRPALRICLHKNRSVFHYTGDLEYLLNGNRITCWQLPHVSDSVLERHFLSGTLLFWLAKSGYLVFHASVVEVHGAAVAFLAESRSGKSALAAALVSRGFPLVSDDDLVLASRDGTWHALPGYPTMRLWPDVAGIFVDSVEGYHLVHPELSKVFVPIGDNGFGTFCGSAAPLKRVYIPLRDDHSRLGVATEELSATQSLIQLYAHAVFANLMPSLGLRQQHFSAVADVARNVDVRTITYPSGLVHLSEIADWILRDVE